MKKFIYLLFGIALLSCNDEPAGETPFEPSVTTFNFEERLPQNMQTDAPLVYSQVIVMQAQMNAVGAFMNNPDGANRSVVQSRTDYNWSYGDFNIDYNYVLVGDQYQFLYTVTYQGAAYYTIEGWQMADGSAGYYVSTIDFDALGMEDFPDYTTEVSWTSNAAGLQMELSFDFGDTMQVFYEMTMNNDGSGDFAYTLNGDLTFTAQWNSDGTGQWTDHMTSPPTVTYW